MVAKSWKSTTVSCEEILKKWLFWFGYFFKIIAMQVNYLWNSCIRKCYERALNIFFYISTYILLMIFEFSLSKWETWHFSNNFSFCKFNVYKNCLCCLLWKLVFHKKFDDEGICVCKTKCLCLEIFENFFANFGPNLSPKYLMWQALEVLLRTICLLAPNCFKSIFALKYALFLCLHFLSFLKRNHY